jgi:uncharacterized protein
MRLFVDANVPFSAALSPEGAASKLFAFAEAGVCELVTSAFVGAEVARNLRAQAPAAEDRWERSSASVGIVAEVDPRLVERLAVPLPAKDRPILAAALGCRATVLVTGDRRHFGPLYVLHDPQSAATIRACGRITPRVAVCMTNCVCMPPMKIPVSARVDSDLVAFLDTYREREGLGSRSEALERAIRSLRDRALEGAYAAAIDEWVASDDAAVWDALAGDGLGPDAPR